MNHRLSYPVKLARACVALMAAYSLALQVLLASVTAAGMAKAPQADGFVICYGGDSKSDDGNSQPSHLPAGSADCVLACAQGLSAGAILPADIPPVLLSTVGQVVERIHAAAFLLSPRPSPRLAQGPPQSA